MTGWCPLSAAIETGPSARNAYGQRTGVVQFAATDPLEPARAACPAILRRVGLRFGRRRTDGRMLFLEGNSARPIPT
jgi:hypothetical protein